MRRLRSTAGRKLALLRPGSSIRKKSLSLLTISKSLESGKRISFSRSWELTRYQLKNKCRFPQPQHFTAYVCPYNQVTGLSPFLSRTESNISSFPTPITLEFVCLSAQARCLPTMQVPISSRRHVATHPSPQHQGSRIKDQELRSRQTPS